MDLEIKMEETKPGSYNIVVNGRIDSTNYTEFEDKVKPLISKKAKNVVLDFAELNYISSSGLGVVFMLMKELKANNGELLLCNLQPQIKKVFEIVKALPTSNIFSSVEEADLYLEHIMNKELEKNDDDA